MSDQPGRTPSREPTSQEFLAALAAWDAVCADLDATWEARQPIQGEATPKVFAYRLAKAVLNAGGLPVCPHCTRPMPDGTCKRPWCVGPAAARYDDGESAPARTLTPENRDTP